MVATVTAITVAESLNGAALRPESQFFQNLDFSTLKASEDIGGMRMIDAYHCFVKDEATSIPLPVWLLENPHSPMALPGSVELKGHDYIHLLLNRGMSLFDEAFVVGFTMGNCDRMKPHHIKVYKTLSSLFFPKAYRFNSFHFRAFDFGVMYGESVLKKNIHNVDFEQYSTFALRDVRRLCGIDLQDIQILWQAELMCVRAA